MRMLWTGGLEKATGKMCYGEDATVPAARGRRRYFLDDRDVYCGIKLPVRLVPWPGSTERTPAVVLSRPVKFTAGTNELLAVPFTVATPGVKVS